VKTNDAVGLWRVLYGPQLGLLGVHSAFRPDPGSRRLYRHRSRFFDYPHRARAAADWCLANSEEGLETYFCAHLLLAKRRVKANATPVLALWADADGAAPGYDAPEPTAIVESSPGRAHLFWRLTRSIPPLRAEGLNRRLLLAVGADRSGWDLGQLLRPPGTSNRKYRPAPPVKLLELTGDRYHPRELELALPPEGPSRPVSRSRPTAGPCPTPDLSRLSGRIRALISRGNRGAGRPYPSRSEADFAVCLAMSAAGYAEAEVWAVMTDSAHGISEKVLEKGRHGDAYLSLTVDKARVLARGAGG
jgi:hypothetical protein